MCSSCEVHGAGVNASSRESECDGSRKMLADEVQDVGLFFHLGFNKGFFKVDV